MGRYDIYLSTNASVGDLPHHFSVKFNYCWGYSSVQSMRQMQITTRMLYA